MAQRVVMIPKAVADGQLQMLRVLGDYRSLGGWSMAEALAARWWQRDIWAEALAAWLWLWLRVQG